MFSEECPYGGVKDTYNSDNDDTYKKDLVPGGGSDDTGILGDVDVTLTNGSSIVIIPNPAVTKPTVTLMNVSITVTGVKEVIFTYEDDQGNLITEVCTC